ncbi:oxidoreductase [Falsiroseomonas sp.]|uniref:oxidoreductase n=1 Tax=Falsiroseomonas sp. TaxID=2870721 RepID=UPI00272238F0|nr:oxidoreductase [Falsiroseomonas sp.]MDO9499304.1 oxidoreductase [Falsiroseomonas sp.]
MTTPTWFITGCSSGFGFEIAREAILRDFNVVATARRPVELEALVALAPDRVQALALDVSNTLQAETAVQSALARFGAIDVLVNNAGRGYLAAIEEGSLDAVRALFETNVFGPLHLTRLVLPGMRARRAGAVVNMSSIGGLVANPGSGFYASTKFSIEGWSEALAKEVAPLGIGVMLVEPGPFRTAWTSRSLTGAQDVIADYASTAGKRRAEISAPDRQQPGDPRLAAQVILDAVLSPSPPLRLVLGRRAMVAAREKMAAVLADIDAWEGVSGGTDVADSAGAVARS